MKSITKIVYLVLALVVIFTGLLYTVAIPPQPVSAAGPLTIQIDCTDNFTVAYYFAGAGDWYADKIADNCTSMAAASSTVGFQTGVTADTWVPYRSILAWDVYGLGMIPVGSKILTAEVKMWLMETESAYLPAIWYGDAMTGYVTPGMDTNVNTGDYSAAYKYGRVQATQAIDFDDMSSVSFDETTFTINPVCVAEWDDMTSGNYLFMTFASMGQMQANAPSNYVWVASPPPGHWQWLQPYYRFASYQTSGVYKPKLILTYVPPVPDRTVTIPEPGPVNPNPIGTETTDNITWGSPRCAYSDETIYIRVNGDSGANITLSCTSSTGQILATHNDSVRTDGLYPWSFTVPVSFTGWIRAYEKNSGIYSKWGYVDTSPSPTMQPLLTYARYTTYPQYDNAFSNYAVYKDGLMFVYWQTDISLAELPDYNLKLLINGNDNYGSMFTGTMQQLADSYYEIEDGNNTWMTSQRYMIFSPQIVSGGFNTGDGLVWNINREYTLQNSGFIVPIIYDNDTETVIVPCHTAYYYLQNAETDGVKITVDNNVRAGIAFGVYINIGAFSHVADRLTNIQIELIDSAGNVYSALSTTGVAGVPVVVPVNAPGENGEYQVRCIFSSSMSPYYSLILDSPFTVMGGTTPTPTATPPPGGIVPPGPLGDWRGWLGRFLVYLGLDNEAGHYLFLFLICVVWVVFLRKNALALTIMLCITVGAGLIMQWLNPWFYILLAGGFAFAVFGLFKKKTGGNRET